MSKSHGGRFDRKDAAKIGREQKFCWKEKKRLQKQFYTVTLCFIIETEIDQKRRSLKLL